MKHLLASLVLCLLALCPAKASTIDSWTNYFSYYDATEVVEADGMLYSIMSGNLMSYNLNTEEVRYIDRISCGLSSKGIRFMGYSDTQHTLVIVYIDGNIDLYNVRTDHVSNLPQFRDNPDSDFSLNNFKVQGDDALISTNEGIVAIDVKNGVIKGRYTVGKTSAAVIYDGRIYAALASDDNKTGTVVSIDLLDNLLDKSRWTTVADMPVTDFVINGDYLYLLCPYNNITKETLVHGIWSLHGSDPLVHVTGAYPTYARAAYGRLIAYGKDMIIEIDDKNPDRYRRVNLTTPFNCIYPSHDGGYWAALNSTGLTHYVLDGENFTADSHSIDGGGPRFEMPYWLRFEGERLYMSPGRIDATDADHRPFFATWLDPDTDEWIYLEEPHGGDAGAGPWLRKNHDFQDVSSIVEDPNDPNHHFVTTGRQGVFEYRDKKIVKQYTEERTKIDKGVASGQSVMKSVSSSLSYDYVRTGAAVYDKDGNLFVANSGGGTEFTVDTIIWCLKRDGNWQGFYYPEIANGTCFENSLIDRKGRLWVTQRRTAGIFGGFLCMDFNGTIDNTKDDVYTYRSKRLTNQDGTSYDFQQALAMAEDHDGRIWLGTEVGLFVVDNPDEWSDPEFLVTQVKVPRPDGIYADYLLNGSVITSIAVDGANRKWIGTSGDGVYLVSADGITLIHHFTKANSPLVSDVILSLACHPTNGEVFIGTDLGLMSYHSDASDATESLQRDNLRVYPNPVRPDYSGPVILDGLVFDSDVKVVSTSGHVVAAGTSVGGTFTWNGRGPSGERVGSGIYYFMVASPDGKEATVAKVAVIR